MSDSSSSSSSSGDDSSALSSMEGSHTLEQQKHWILQAASTQSTQSIQEEDIYEVSSSQSVQQASFSQPTVTMSELRRSTRQRREPNRLVIKDESSESSNRRPKRNNNNKKTSTLSDSSSEDDEDDSDYHTTTWKTGSSLRRSTKKSAITKARQYNAKNKPKAKPAVTTRRQHKAQIRGRSSGSDSQSVGFSTGSEEESVQPTRSSRRAQTSKTISYKENDSNQETDSDDYVETAATDAAAYEEDANAPKIEKIMDGRFGRQGATGVETTAFNVRLHGDKNGHFNPNEESEERHYLIKWNGRSHLHNTWESEDSLYEMNCSGLKRLENFKRKRMNINSWMRQASLEDQEYYMCQQEMNRNVLENYRTVERVFARSAEQNEFGRYDYRVKWVGLPYIESTWEDSSLIKEDFQNHIDEFSMRQENPCVPKRECRAIRHRPNFVAMTQQPDWLEGKLKLRDYQLEGVNWLSRSWCKGNSVILADEMGLGKTIQTITFLSYLYHTHELYGLFLVIVPLSTMTAWQNEFQTWAPFMNVIVYMGDQSSRALIRDVEWKFPNGHFKFNAVLTSYEILLKDKNFLGSHSWAVIAVDEAHRLKNEDSLLYKSLIEFKSNQRILITGTPMQNSLKELWALLHFIMPDTFESWPRFEDDHAENHEGGYGSLHKALHPYLLRRVKKDVEKSLPQKVEKILRVQMAKKQKQFYKWILTRNYAALRKGGRGRGGFSSFCNIVMELKKCCNHAHLINEPTFPDDVDQETVFQDLLKSSGKMVLLDKLLIRFKQDGHRVLIFSQMVQMLDIIQVYLRKRRFQFQRLDGSVDSASRTRALDHFNAEGSEDFCFLLSTRAGGLGINLATADTVIIFDSDWNPMNDLQAQARAHRIGQKKQVHIFRLVCAGSVEENIVERAKQKMVLDHLVIQRMDTSGKTVLFKQSANSSNSNNPFNKEELNRILQFGAEGLFAETENDEKEPECDIDDILQRAELRQEQSGSSAYEELLSGFKVATFKMDEEEGQLKDWDDIIPQKERQAIEDEEKLKKEKEMFLAPRQRKSLKFNDGSDEEEDSDSLPTNEDEEDTTSKRHRTTGGRKGNRDWDDEHVQGFTTAEVRKFVRSFRKFGDPLNRLDAIARDAELNEQSEADLKRLGKALYDRLQSMSNDIKSSQDHQEESSKRGRGPSFRLAGVSVSVKTTLACIENLKPLSDTIPKSAEERRNFRFNLSVRPISTWDCSWSIEDDSKLLVGIYEHGMGNWEQIQSDPNLSLGQKILRPNNEKPQIRQLTSRSDHLIKALVKSQRNSSKSMSKSTVTTNSTASASITASSTTSSRRSNRNNEAKQATVTPELTKTRTRGRKAKSKAVVEEASEQEDPAENYTPSSSTSRKSRKSKRKLHHNVTTVTPSGENSVKEEDSEVPENHGRAAKRRKKNKVENSKSSSHSSSLPMTINSDSVLIGLDVDSVELTDKAFVSCKEQLRPVKVSLKQLVQKYAQPEKEENLEQVRREHMTKCLLQIGDRIIECLRCLHKPEEIKKTRTNLWNFVSKFTEYNANKWLKLYKSAVENRDFKLEGHKEESNAVKSDVSSPHKHKKSHKDKRSSASADTQSSRSHHRHGKESRKHHQNDEQSSKNEKTSSHSSKAKHSTSPTKSSQDMRLHPHPPEDSWSSRGGSRSSASNHQRPPPPDCAPPGAPPADYWPPSGNPDYRRAPRSPERSGGRFPPRGGDEYGGSGDFRSSGAPPPPPYGRHEYRRSPPPPRDYYNHLPPSSGGDRRGGPPMYNYSPPRGYGGGGGYHGGGPPPHPNYHHRRWRPPPERSYPPPPSSRNPPSGYGGAAAPPYSEDSSVEPDGPSSIRRAEKT